MGRAEERIQKKMEKNPAVECNKIQQDFYPELFQKFSETLDPRNLSYVLYPNRIMLGTLYYKGIAGIVSMQSMNAKFNSEEVSGNLRGFMGEEAAEYLPHYITENEYLERLDPQELQDIMLDIVYKIIRRRSFEEARFMKKWLVIVDGTQLYSGDRKLNDKCLERCHNKGTEKEKTSYHCDVLEAKIYFGESLVASIGSEFIENNGEDAERQKGMSQDEIKQDCETKAFKRLAANIKQKFPRLPIILLADSLYASEPVMGLCREYGWDYIIRFKDGSIPSVASEYKDIPEKGRAGNAEYVNGIDYNGNKVNLLKYKERQVHYQEDRRCRNGKPKTRKPEIREVDFQWITNIEITDKNAGKLAAAGRIRWKVENEGFNRQKNWQGDITHACSWNDRAQKNHYLMMQISDAMKQLYEHCYLKRKGISKKQKDISSDLLKSFDQQPTREDISLEMEMHSATIH